ncbi:hypothetical protein OG21DRAFT_1506752 [Imleria badia]|nr:hypothetical protein OG21DRAFT_1506752 [Imleria badia]
MLKRPRCAVHSTSFPIISNAFDVALALPTALDGSRLGPLASMASSPGIWTLRARFGDALIPVAAGAHPIIFGALDSLSAVRLGIVLDASQLGLLTLMTSWPGIWVLRIRFDDALVPLAPGVYPIAFTSVDNFFAIRIALDDSQLVQVAQLTSWRSISTRHARLVEAPIRLRPSTTCSSSVHHPLLNKHMLMILGVMHCV